MHSKGENGKQNNLTLVVDVNQYCSAATFMAASVL